jgi:hypothetical protein
MAKIAYVQWYATVFRGDQLERALEEIAPVALRYGATEFLLMRAGDDRYRMHQFSWFENKLDWDSYWLGPEFVAWRADFSSFYQVPLVYAFHEQVARGEIAEAADPDRAEV